MTALRPLGRRLALATAACAVAAALAAADARACSCAADPELQLRRADAAVSARLLRVVHRRGAPDRYLYRVRRVFKGKRRIQRGQRLRVVDEIGATCGLPRRRDRAYGLFLDRRDGRWTAGLCDVTRPRRLAAAAHRGRAPSRRASGPAGTC